MFGGVYFGQTYFGNGVQDLDFRIQWPLSLPAPLRIHRRAVQSHSATTEMESRRTRKRRGFKESREVLELSWNFTADQFDAFKGFFERDLENGSLSFLIYLLEGEREVEFVEPDYSFSHSDNLYSVNAVFTFLEPLPLPPALCPPPATPTVTGKCDGEADVTFVGSIGRPYEIYYRHPAAAPNWTLGASGTIDVSPKTVELTGLSQGYAYLFYVSVNEVFCGFKDSESVPAVIPWHAQVTIESNKLLVDPGESFVLSWTSFAIHTTASGGCSPGQVSITQGVGCKPGNINAGQTIVKSAPGAYTYEITGSNPCGTATASVTVNVRTHARGAGSSTAIAELKETILCGPDQPFCIQIKDFRTLENPDVDLLTGQISEVTCDIIGSETSSQGPYWEGRLYQDDPLGNPCSWVVPFAPNELIATYSCGVDTLCGFLLGGAHVKLLSSPPRWELEIRVKKFIPGSSFSSKVVWKGEKFGGSNPFGVYDKISSCASGPEFFRIVPCIARCAPPYFLSVKIEDWLTSDYTDQLSDYVSVQTCGYEEAASGNGELGLWDGVLRATDPQPPFCRWLFSSYYETVIAGRENGVGGHVGVAVPSVYLRFESFPYPRWVLTMSARRVDGGDVILWEGEKLIGDSPLGDYARIDGCANNPTGLTVVADLD